MEQENSENGGMRMRKVILTEQVKLTGVKNFTGKDKLIDYYIEQPGRDKIYAFSKIFTQNIYDMCKSGIRVNELSTKRSRDRGVMRLVNYLNMVLPYLSEYYGLMRKGEGRMRGRRGCYGGYYGGGGDLMGLIAVALLAIVAMPLVGGYVLVTGKDEGSKLLDGALLVGGLIVWAALGLR